MADVFDNVDLENIDIDQLPPERQKQFLDLLKEHQRLKNLEEARCDFLTFVKTVWPQVLIGPHHRILAEKFKLILEGKLKRLMISIPPRSGKSEFTSWLLPAFLIAMRPESQILHASHTLNLVEGFGRRIRDLIDSPTYKELFPTVKVRKDMKSATRWGIDGTRGIYRAFGTGSALAGVGGDFIILDDIVSEKTVTDGGLDAAWQWYQEGLYTRLMPGGVIIAVATRWSKADPLGRIQEKMKRDPNYEKWDVINIPAINYAEGHEGDDEYALHSHWEDFWPLKEMLRIKASVGSYAWQSQYMGDPTGRDTGIISSEGIQWWEGSEYPPVEFIIQSYDTAFEKEESHDPTSFTMWGVFTPRGEINGRRYDGQRKAVICLGHITKNMDYPGLKKFALGQYRAHLPDVIVVEAKGSGIPMIQELRRAHLPVHDYSPSIKTGNKRARFIAVSTMFDEGLVFFPKHVPWAEELVQCLLDFPNGTMDDPVDSTTQALNYVRHGRLVSVKDDDDHDIDETPSMAPSTYYNV